MTKTIHPNSIESHQITVASGVVERRRNLILEAIRELGGVASDRTIARHLNFAELNAVRPRITEMMIDKTLEDAGRKFDADTNRTVRLVRIRRQQRDLF